MLLVILIPTVKLYAVEEFLEARDYITSMDDAGAELNSFLLKCESEGKDAFLNSGTYILREHINLPSNVSLIGDDETVIRGENGDYQIDIYSNDKKSNNIEIKNIIFDNVCLYLNRGKNINFKISNNIFMNAKMVSLVDNPQLKPDKTNQNGGENTGYYILATHQENLIIEGNVFLRNKESLGRGIATYSTNNTKIIDNYFGKIEGLANSINSAKTKELLKKLSSFNLSNDEGYFMTAINNLNYDKAALISGNHFDLNTDIFERQYENKSNDSRGYNKDHVIYSKGYDDLRIVGNYLKGSNKNQDGGIKCRNGVNLLIHKNVLEDQIILLYVQKDKTQAVFKNVEVSNNIFLNRGYTSKRLEYPNPKYIVIDYLILFRNYVNDSDVGAITIENNNVISKDRLPNEEIRIHRMNASDAYYDFHIEGNRANTRDVKIKDPIGANKEYYSLSVGNKFNYDTKAYSSIDPYKLLRGNIIAYKIIDNKITTAPGTSIFVDGRAYNGEAITNEPHKIVIMREDKERILVDSVTEYGSFSYEEYPIISYSFDEISGIRLNQLVINASICDIIDLYNVNYELSKYALEQISGFDIARLDGHTIRPLKSGSHAITIKAGGNMLRVSLNIDTELINIMPRVRLSISYPRNDKMSYDIKLSIGAGISNNQMAGEYGVIILSDLEYNTMSLDINAIKELRLKNRAYSLDALEDNGELFLKTKKLSPNQDRMNILIYNIEGNKLTLSRARRISLAEIADIYLASDYLNNELREILMDFKLKNSKEVLLCQ